MLKGRLKANISFSDDLFLDLNSINNVFAVAFQNRFDFEDGFFGRRMYAGEFVGIAAQCPFVRTQFVIGKEFDHFDIVHIGDKFAEQVGGTVVVGIAWDDDVADACGLFAFGEVVGEFEGFGVGDADEDFVDFGVDLF